MHFPPLLFAGVRQAVAGMILGGLALAFHKKTDFSGKNVLRQALVGFLMLSLGNGLVTWGEKYIPSGVAALICSLMPIFAVLFNLVTTKTERLNLLTALGMVLGTCGVGLIFRQDISKMSNPVYLGGILATLFATSSWALGSIVNKKTTNPANPFLNSGMQLFFGGIFMLIGSLFLEDVRHVDFSDRNGLLALLYLITFGSVLAYGAYMYALSKLPIGIATLYAYINPPVAVILGYLALGEPINGYTVSSFVAIMVGVYVVNRGYRNAHQAKMAENKDTLPDAFPENIPIES
jgi:drug/metabolite transporter (DMT)-like permease